MQCLRKYDIINVYLSVCLSVYAGIVSERMDIIVEIFGQPGRAIILGFIAPPPLQSFKRNPYSGGALNTRVWENFTSIAIYLGNGTKQGHGYYGTLIGSSR